MKKLLTTLLITTSFLTACSSQNDENTVKIGAIAGPEAELVEAAAVVAKERYNLNVKVVEFHDFVTPNTALADGSIDANAYQTVPFLEETIAARGYSLVSVGRTFIYPIGLYSKRHKSLDQLPNGAVIAIPNDPSNGARALLILQEAKLIKLKNNVSTKATLQDIVQNPKNLQIREIEAAQLTRTLQDVDLAAINTVFAAPAGLLPNRDALYVESKTSPYANIIVVRAGDENKTSIKEFVSAYQSEEVAKRAQELFKGQAVPAW